MLHITKTHSGFTLAEVLIVITIIVIISTGVLIGINPISQIFRGYDAVRKSDLSRLKTSFEAYYTDHDCYPTADILKQCGGANLQPYLESIPCDPQDHQTPYSLKMVPEGAACPQSFAVYGTINSPTDPIAKKIPSCPGTMAVSSPNMSYLDVIQGCSGIDNCRTLYGCKSGQCVAVGYDELPNCSPGYCDSDCGGVDCGKIARGKMINECVPL